MVDRVARSFEQSFPRLLSQTAFLYDGDLALFGNAARMFRGILGCRQAMRAHCRTRMANADRVLRVLTEQTIGKRSS
ncbi:hypothetical protein [Streptomyces sp. CB01373]|uniref:hypothetical protein n=1 Tax=Streptomyces sp. CB01373 TaxID=2020325 RepID=UPI000C279025|nr:hypothetical protein [Streptomyces sp. CB01373]PJM91518.1 hypothetical protein CG719_33665 [Streptomyces sp. CB01373]